jgi:hypothetical protein
MSPPAKRPAGDDNFVHGENKPEVLIGTFGLEFSQKELVVRQHEKMFRCEFDAQSV